MKLCEMAMGQRQDCAKCPLARLFPDITCPDPEDRDDALFAIDDFCFAMERADQELQRMRALIED